jgi:membrane protease YdiL (CAAX protease family)
MNGTLESISVPVISNPPSRREQTYEVITFCCLIVPGMLFSLAIGPSEQAPFTITALATIINDIALVILISFLLWHNQETFRRVGWITRGFLNEAFIGVILFLPMTYSLSVLEMFFHSLGLTVPKSHIPAFLTPSGTNQVVLAVLLVVIVAIAEETIFRGYFILRLKSLTNSKTAAVLLSSLIFCIGHGYEGTAGMATIYVLGVIFAAVYLWRKSLVAPIVMHFLQDFLGIVVLPLITSK